MVLSIMEAEFRLNFQDVREAQITHFQASRFWRAMRKVVIPFMFLAIVLPLGVGLLLKEPTSGSFLNKGPFKTVPFTRLILLTPLLLQGGLAALIASPSWSPINKAFARRTFQASSDFKVIHQVAIDEAGLLWHKNSSPKRRDWKSFKGFRETQNLYLLYNSFPSDVEMLPKRAFSPEHLARLHQVLSQNVSEL